MKTIQQKLQALTSPLSVSGFEWGVLPVISELIGTSADRVYTDKLGSLHAVRFCGREGAPTVLLDAHIDEIGMIVTHVTPEGFLRVAPVGGIDTRLLCAAEVTIHGPQGEVAGVVCSTPPHLSDGQDDKLPKVEDIAIDTGLTGEELEQRVKVGSPVRFRVPFTPLLGGQIAAQGLDDKACCAVVLEVLDRLQGKALNCDVHALFSVQEETGLAWARTGSFGVDVELAIVLDVNFALQPGCDERRCVTMGKGAAFSLSPSTSIAQTRRMMDYAVMKDLPHQALAEAPDTGTNATAIAISREGIPTVVISVPLKNMHTPSEVVLEDDIDSIAQLIASYIEDWQ